MGDSLIHKIPSVYIISLLFILILFSVSASYSKEDSGFPEIKGRFGSKTESVKISNIAIDYYDKVRYLFEDGELHRRKNKNHNFDFFFVGKGKVIILDSASLDNLWYWHFKRETSVEFTTSYICGRNIPELFKVDSTEWSKDKINGRIYHKLIYQQKAADNYFGIELGCELGMWSEKEVISPPIWIDATIKNNKQLVTRLAPDIDEQLRLYVYDELNNKPYLIAAYGLTDYLISKPINVDTTVIDIILKESGRLEASCRIVFATGTDTRGMDLYLPHLYKVDSVIDATGDKIPFFKKKYRNNLYVSQRERSANEEDYITIYYRGKFIAASYQGYDYRESLTGWFPHTHRRNLTYFIINYRFHKDLTLNSVGQKILEKIDGDHKVVTYHSKNFISYISFAIGKYDVYIDTSLNLPISLYIGDENSIGLFNQNIPHNTLSDVVESFKNFTAWFGESRTFELKVVDQLYFGGQSSPGLIHFSGFSYFKKKDLTYLIAHEVAHQWWGHSIRNKTYHDLWLSEGLAEYSSYLYLWKIKHDTTYCREMIDGWKGHVIEEGKIGNLYSRGYKAGSISLGWRLGLSYSPGDYIALIYAKAAYMLRMLHFEIDGPDYRTDFFLNMMGEFNRKYRGQRVTSLDFINVAASAMGQKRAVEFFSQWLYGWRIPSFHCLYRIVTDERGRDKLYFEISVSDVGSSFSTPYPIEIEFDDGKRELFRVDGVGQNKSYELGPFPQKIKKVRFDPDDIILTLDKKVSQK